MTLIVQCFVQNIAENYLLGSVKHKHSKNYIELWMMMWTLVYSNAINVFLKIAYSNNNILIYGMKQPPQKHSELYNDSVH